MTLSQGESRVVSIVGVLLFIVVLSIATNTNNILVLAQTFGLNGAAAGQAGERQFSGIAYDSASQVYVTTTQSPTKMIKFLTQPVFVRSTAVTFSAGEDNCPAIAIRGTVAYIACNPGLGVGKIMRRHVNNPFFGEMSSAGSSIDRSAAYEQTLTSIFTDSNYVYAVSADADSGIVRINLGSFTYRDTLQLTGINSTTAIITASETHILGATNTSPIELYRTDLSTFSRFNTEQLFLNAGESGMDIGLAEDGTYVYAGTTGATPAFIVKVQMSPFTRISALTLDSGENLVSGLTANGLTGVGYISLDQIAPAKLVRFELSTMNRLGSASGSSSSSNSRRSMLLNQNLYVLTAGITENSHPGRMIRLTIATTTTTLGPTTSSTTTTSTTTTATSTTTSTTSTTTSTTTTPAPPTTSSTTTTPVPPPPGFGEDDNSLAVDAPSSVAIAAGLAAGAGAIGLIVMIVIISGKTAAVGAATAAAGVAKEDDNDAATGDFSPQIGHHHEEGGTTAPSSNHGGGGGAGAEEMDVFESHHDNQFHNNNNNNEGGGLEDEMDYGNENFDRPQPRFDDDDGGYGGNAEME